MPLTGLELSLGEEEDLFATTERKHDVHHACTSYDARLRCEWALTEICFPNLLTNRGKKCRGGSGAAAGAADGRLDDDSAARPSPSPRDLMGKVMLKGKTVWVAETSRSSGGPATTT